MTMKTKMRIFRRRLLRRLRRFLGLLDPRLCCFVVVVVVVVAVVLVAGFY